MTMRRVIAAAALLSIVSTRDAEAGGLGRPNVISARAFGFGGAFGPIADDASALHYNPAGMALQPKSSVLFGAEVILAPRSYTPIRADNSIGEPQEPDDTPVVVPTLGFVGRPKVRGVPSRLAFGVGLWNTFGGQLRYDKGDPSEPALDYVQDAVIEVVTGIAYEVNDFLSIGGALRVGIGLFSIEATAKPADGEFSATGIGAGLTLGMMIRPSKKLQIGLTWRSAMTISTSGDGELLLDPLQPPAPVDVTHDQNWPQSASLGVAFLPTSNLRLAVQADWTDWSYVETIEVHFPGRNILDQIYDEDWDDTYALHAGGEVLVTPALAVRAGYTFDSQAVPDRTIERQYLDAPKHAVGGGLGVQIHESWRVDAAFEYIFGPAREIENNRQEYSDAGWPDRANVAPGTHEGNVYTFELQAQFQY
jgi:long-chain fatty acid transport protein